MKIFRVVSDEPYSNYYMTYVMASDIEEAKTMVCDNYSNDECLFSIEELTLPQIIAHNSLTW